MVGSDKWRKTFGAEFGHLLFLVSHASKVADFDYHKRATAKIPLDFLDIGFIMSRLQGE